ncbi:MAG: MEDS domain-containing protein [Candidatus Thorarchaeota archaeon]|nr:MEDS domain-containing protein [Candidatus Thorarchaeota archaeon]
MPNLNDSTKTLSEFGLSPYEARVYLSVHRLGLTTASNIAKATGIRREEVYRTIPKLERAGFIERVLGRPSKVRALPIEDVLSILIERKEEDANNEIRRLLAKKNELLKKFQQEPEDTKITEEKPHFTLISEKDALEKRITFLINRAEYSVDFVDTFENAFRFVLTFADDLIMAKKRDVKIRIITEYPDNANLIPDTLRKHLPEDSFEIRYFESLTGNYVIFDSHQALITTSSGSTIPDGRCLWTDDSSLVGIVQRDFNELHHESIDWREHKATSDEKLMRILKRLKPRDHVILIYESREAKHNTLFSYIDRGLKRGEAAIYVCSEESTGDIKAAMKDFGIDVIRYENNGALNIMSYDEMYIKDGNFNIDNVMNSWSEAYDQAMSKGFSGMRVTGEMSCFIDHNLVEELIEYEHKLHAVLDIPMTAICAYNADTLTKVDNPIDVYSELVKAHGKVLFAGKDKSIGKIEIRAG